MKRLFMLILISSTLLFQTAYAKTIEVDVHGMTCAFCVDSLERKLGKMKSVSNVRISLKTRKIRFDMEGTHPSIEIIKQAILDAGFTPIKISILSDDKYQN